MLIAEDNIGEMLDLQPVGTGNPNNPGGKKLVGEKVRTHRPERSFLSNHSRSASRLRSEGGIQLREFSVFRSVGDQWIRE
jgi:hypothetical protein